jgi:hypothetical protein
MLQPPLVRTTVLKRLGFTVKGHEYPKRGVTDPWPQGFVERISRRIRS